MAGNFISGARTALAGSGLRFDPLAFSGTIPHGVASRAEYPFKFFATAFRAFKLYLFVLVHDKQFNTFLAV
jgi:hypothetical protein